MSYALERYSLICDASSVLITLSFLISHKVTGQVGHAPGSLSKTLSVIFCLEILETSRMYKSLTVVTANFNHGLM